MAVPVAQLAAYIRDVTHAADEIGLKITLGAHASAGCLHVSPFVNLKNQEDIFKMKQLAQATAELVLNYKGALSSEHGDGLARSWLNRHVFGEEIYNAFKQVKRAFDPHNLMNPGKIVDGPPIENNLRFGINYSTIQPNTQFDWSAEGGIVNAIEQCSGVGYCRKVDSGTLCPSYQVTLDERDSTRGRANALRNALSGKLPREKLLGDEMRGVLDLCVGCKACQSECPSSIDMARIKSEWQHLYHQQHGLSLGEWFFANMPRIGEWLSHVPALAKFANGLLDAELIAAPIKKILGVAQERNLPKFEPLVIDYWQSKKLPIANSQSQNQVVLYLDTWSRHHYPHIAAAAYEVLSAAGFDVIVPKYVCCGRTYISKGLLNEARESADAVIENLSEFVMQGIPVVGLEPSCILSFRDEYPSLSTHSHRHSLVKLAFTFEEFVANNVERFSECLQRSKPSEGFERSPCQVLLHGHCHQKAQVGTKPAHTALQLAGYVVTEVDSGCCGMAGSFGYEADHYAISQQMAERALMPAVHNASDDTLIVAAGVSCRQQIKDFSGRTALHPAEVLRACLK